ncbi:DNA ligase [Thalassocella blandensis]|nr:DNA ligase [Thalassocella blandensis]
MQTFSLLGVHVYYIQQLRLILLNTCAILFCAYPILGNCNADVPVQLAQVYDDDPHVDSYLVSEKYDGVRAIWKDGKLQTRNGNIIHAPDWFVADLPDVWLDGELWSKRQDFEFIASTVSKHTPVDNEWRKIRYMVFDAPNTTQTFQERAEYYTQLINALNLVHVKPVTQFTVNSNAHLSSLLEQYTNAGAEGLMLHKAQAMFINGRNQNLLKLKPYMDAEAIVLAHLPGKGKYKAKMGSIKVRWQKDADDFVEFNIGTGFTDKERENPPAIGSTITFKYHGLTKNKLPRFPSYLRIRTDAE